MYKSAARIVLGVFFLVNVALTMPVWGQNTLDMPVGEMYKHEADSGILGNMDKDPVTVWDQVVGVEGAAWVRVYFDRNTKLNTGSVVRITSLHDREVQELDSQSLAKWNYSSAYFNGSSVLVELVAGGSTIKNRVVIDQVALQFGAANKAGNCGICGGDTRTPSDEDWSGRLLPAGCTASIYNTDSCLVSAGHCIAGNDVVQFRVPNSAGDCNINHPPAADQFPITNVQFANGGVGNDWSALRSGQNNLGQTIFERYGAFVPLATTSPAVGNSVNVWGFGVDSQCTLSQTQQVDTNPGTVTEVFSSYFRHTTDATFGNSGSALVRNGQILGIATHCPCPNYGTRIDLGAFVNARQNICKSTGPENDNCQDAEPIGEGSFDFDTSQANTDGPALPAECEEGFGLSLVNDIWFEYTASCTGQATIDLCASNYDTRMAVYTGEGGCPGAHIDCNDDFCELQSQLVIDVVAGEDYIIRVGGFNSGGTGTMDVSCEPVGPSTITPDSFVVFRGIQTAGDLSDVEESDDSYLEFNPGLTLDASEAPVWIEFEGTLPTDSPTSLAVTLEASANTPNLSQTIEAFNWLTGEYEEVGIQFASFPADSVFTVDLTADIGKYVEPGTGTVKTRTGWRTTGGLLLLSPWTIFIDQVVWTITE